MLIFATDGVWDNLSQLELLKIVSRMMTDSQAWVLSEGKNGIDVSDSLGTLTTPAGNVDSGIVLLQSKLASHIVSEAKSASEDSRRDGPFAREVQRHYPGENYRGGKVDDICVVAAVVVEEGKGGVGGPGDGGKVEGGSRVRERARL